MGRVSHPPTHEEIRILHAHAQDVRNRARQACEDARVLVAKIDAWERVQYRWRSEWAAGGRRAGRRGEKALGFQRGEDATAGCE